MAMKSLRRKLSKSNLNDGDGFVDFSGVDGKPPGFTLLDLYAGTVTAGEMTGAGGGAMFPADQDVFKLLVASKVGLRGAYI